MIKNIKEKIIGHLGSFSGITSLLSSWQVCHNVCLAIMSALAVLGITLTIMPFEFLTKIAVPVWTFAFILLMLSIGFYLNKKCISKTQLYFNSGLIIASVPFQPVQSAIKYFWLIGASLVLIGTYGYFNNKFWVKKND